MMNSTKNNTDLALLFVRLGLAAVFLSHGIGKLIGLDMTMNFFGGFLHIPMAVTYLVIAVEVLGGAAMLLGIFTQIAGVLLALVMTGAIYFVHAAKGYSGQGGYEFPLLVFLCAIAIAVAGAGKYALDSKMGMRMPSQM